MLLLRKVGLLGNKINTSKLSNMTLDNRSIAAFIETNKQE